MVFFTFSFIIAANKIKSNRNLKGGGVWDRKQKNNNSLVAFLIDVYTFKLVFKSNFRVCDV